MRTLPGLDAHHRRIVLYVGLGWNLLISAHPDYVLTHRITPVAPGRTAVECQWLFPPWVVARPGFDPTFAVDFWDLTNRQDWTAIESVQRGVASPAFVPGLFSPDESAVHQFIGHIAERYQAGRDTDDVTPGNGAGPMLRRTRIAQGGTIVVRLHKLSRVLLGATLVVGLAACGGDNEGTSAGGGATTTSAGAAGTCGDLSVAPVSGFKPVKSDTLTVVTSLPGPGFWVGSSTDPNDIKAGYEYCMAKAIQEAFGLKNLRSATRASTPSWRAQSPTSTWRSAVLDHRRSQEGGRLHRPVLREPAGRARKGRQHLKVSTLTRPRS